MTKTTIGVLGAGKLGTVLAPGAQAMIGQEVAEKADIIARETSIM
ncbi:hypothetical protein WN867_10060 [Tetragenococcus halophilus]